MALISLLVNGVIGQSRLQFRPLLKQLPSTCTETAVCPYDICPFDESCPFYNAPVSS